METFRMDTLVQLSRKIRDLAGSSYLSGHLQGGAEGGQAGREGRVTGGIVEGEEAGKVSYDLRRENIC